ncbi:dihydrofolate reductase family protein [Streptococcus hyovaginalis]
MSLDGIVEGLKDAMDISFVRYYEELETFANQRLSTCDAVLLGRATDEMMRAYWSTMLDNPEATAYERNQAAWIEQVQKVVCSRSLKKPIGTIHN